MRFAGKGFVSCVMLAALVAVGCGESEVGRSGAAPRGGVPVLGAVPDFELIDQSGNTFGSSDLRGRVYLADFIFTRCSAMCPMLSNQMAGVQRELAADGIEDRVQLVSISVDPENDDPATLVAYGERYAADFGTWTFLTGDRDEIWNLSVAGFKLAVGERPEGADTPLFHSDKFVLVDSNGRIRGYYSPLDKAGRAQLITDLATVLDEANRRGAQTETPDRI